MHVGFEPLFRGRVVPAIVEVVSGVGHKPCQGLPEEAGCVLCFSRRSKRRMMIVGKEPWPATMAWTSHVATATPQIVWLLRPGEVGPVP